MMCGWAGPQRKMIRVGGGDSADWARLIRWGGTMRHNKWACRDEAACQERQAQRPPAASTSAPPGT
jgi:hypothetical protein